MANEQSGVRFFIVLALLCFTTGTYGNDAGPILEAVQGFLSQASKGQSAGLNVWGSVLQGLLQSDGGKNLAQLFTSGRQSTTMNLISGLGALMQAQAQKSDGDDGKASEGFDPAMLGTVMDLFASLNEAQNEDKEVVEKTKPNKKVKREENSNTDWEPILSVIGNAVGSMMTGDGKSSGGGAGLESLMSFLPVIMSSIGGRHHPHSSENVPHHDHAPFLPPFLENIHEYWDHFLNSQFGKTLYESSGLSAMMDQFRDKSGKVVPERIFDSLENNTFRRKWIRGISSFVAEWANHISDTETQKKYLETVKVIVNSFLQSEGYPKSAFLDWNKPGDSISNLVDYVVKKQLSMSVKSGHYIKPAVEYFQVIFGQSQKAGILASMTAQTVESRLTNTLEAELIEPILRANRGYKFIKRNPECAKYVICAINADAENNSVGLRPAAAKASNMAVAWFASGKDSFFELYGATSETDCEEFDNNCNDFHVEDSKATTEYFHNEL